MSICIPCAGEGERWQNHRGVPKQLVAPYGETLLHRTTRLASRWGDGRCRVLVREDFPIQHHHALFSAVRVRDTVPVSGTGKLLCGLPFWEPLWNTLILGDVWLSDAAAEHIFLRHPSQGVRWYGRAGASDLNGKRYGEIFALVWLGAMHSWELLHAALEVQAHCRTGMLTREALWEVYRVFDGLNPRNQHFTNVGPSWSEIDDQTEDFDFPADYETWCDHWNVGMR